MKFKKIPKNHQDLYKKRFANTSGETTKKHLYGKSRNALLSRPQTLHDCYTNKVENRCVKFPMLQIVIISKVPPHEHFNMRVSLENK